MKLKRKLYKGIPISDGVGMGITRVLQYGSIRVAETVIPPSKVRDQIDSLERAVAGTIVELRELRDSAGKKAGGPVAKVFDAQLLIAADDEFLKQVKEQIRSRRRNAAFVYNSAVNEATFTLNNSPDQYMRQMAGEIEAVARKVLLHLLGSRPVPITKFPHDSILVCEFFSPGDILAFRNRKAVGFVSGRGGRNSHTGLIARSLLVPVVVLENGWRQLPGDCRIIIDGNSGVVIISPTDDEWRQYQKKRKRQGPALITRIKKLSPIPPKTRDGIEITVAANLELPGPADNVLAAQKIPVGLYRTEFLYLERERFPGENEQVNYFCNIAENFSESHAVIRTYDLGGDKVLSGDLVFGEENPALGFRGIRVMLEMQDIYRDQIRAILRASTRGNIRIMLPMVSDVGEFERARKIIAQIMFDLRKEGIPFDEKIPVGIMIEVPSAALMADELAKKVDFMSIGTNDLTQYTMSADRNNRRVAELYNFLHPSVLKLIKMTIDAGKRHNTPVGICGEAAGDLLALPLFIGMGVHYFSMNPQKIVDVSRLIAKIDSELVRHLVASVMSSNTALQVTRRLQSYRTALDKKNP